MSRRVMGRRLCQYVLICVGLAVGLTASVALPAYGQDDAPHRELFEVAWNVVAEEYAGLLAGIDWVEARRLYEPHVVHASSEEEAYAYLKEMVSLLGDPGTFVLTPAEMRQIDAAAPPSRFGGVGMMLRQMLESDIVIVEVFNRSPAQRAGLRKGARISAVDGVSTRGLSAADVAELIKGQEGTTTHITVAEPGGAERTVAVRRGLIDVKTEVTSERLSDGMGYIKLPSLHDGIEASFLTHLRQMYRTRGLVIDLRSLDRAASLRTVSRIAGLLTDEPLGGVLTRRGAFSITADREWEGGTGSFAVPPPTRLDFYDKPVVLLVDTGIVESPLGLLLVTGLQRSGRVQLVGRGVPPSLGVGSGQINIELPGGGLLSVTNLLLVTLDVPEVVQSMTVDAEVPFSNDYLGAWYAGGDLDVETAVRLLVDQLN